MSRTSKYYKTRPRKTPEERFWAKVDKSGDCWIWTGGKNKHGYGTFGFQGKVQKAHRVAWQLENGPIPIDPMGWHHGTCVLHKCDNPPCVNPDHLFLGTHQDNMDDKTRRSRNRNRPYPGVTNPNSKLNDELVRDARRMYSTGNYHPQLLADFYDVSRTTMRYALTGRTWKHVQFASALRSEK